MIYHMSLTYIAMPFTSEVQPPVALWMSQGMSKHVDLKVESTAAVRIDVSVQPPFLPLEVELRRKREMSRRPSAGAVRRAPRQVGGGRGHGGVVRAGTLASSSDS